MKTDLPTYRLINLCNEKNPLVTVTKNPVDREEFLVYPKGNRNHPACYFTTDIDDAIHTATAMQSHLEAASSGFLPSL